MWREKGDCCCPEGHLGKVVCRGVRGKIVNSISPIKAFYLLLTHREGWWVGKVDYWTFVNAKFSLLRHYSRAHFFRRKADVDKVIGLRDGASQRSGGATSRGQSSSWSIITLCFKPSVSELAFLLDFILVQSYDLTTTITSIASIAIRSKGMTWNDCKTSFYV